MMKAALGASGWEHVMKPASREWRRLLAGEIGTISTSTCTHTASSYLQLEHYWMAGYLMLLSGPGGPRWARWTQGAMEQDDGWFAELQVRLTVVASLGNSIAKDSLFKPLPHLHNTCHA